MKTITSRWWASLLILAVGLFFISPTPKSAHSQDAVQVVESDDPRVLQLGTWSTQIAPAASNSKYLFSTPSSVGAGLRPAQSTDHSSTLALAFVGSAIEIIYVSGPQFGTLAIEIDGTVVRTVITTAEKIEYGLSARVDYLSDEPHSLKVYAQSGGLIAVDAFRISPLSMYGEGPGGEVAFSDSGDGGIQASTCAPLNAIHRVSLTSTGASFAGALSATGRYVTFASSTSLVAGDGDAFDDVYVYDRQTCTVQLVSTSSTGLKGNGDSSDIGLSSDGRYVAFTSVATNLVAGDTNGQPDVFVHDRQTTTTTRVSVASGGIQASGHSRSPSISADGRYVTFDSSAPDLVVGDTNGQFDIFVHDRQTGTTTRVSVATGGVQATGGVSTNPNISADGRYVTFQSVATNLVAGDTNSVTDIFLHDRNTGTTTRVSVATGGVQATGGTATGTQLSADGRYVAFSSGATNLVSGDTNSTFDVFVHDRNTGITTRVSVTGSGAQATGGDSSGPSFSADGRYVTFGSTATNLVTGDTNGQIDVFVTPRAQSTGDTLVLFNPTFEQVNLIDTLADTPATDRYTAFSVYPQPTTPGLWVMGDWNGDGLDTPGVYLNGPFYYTNKSGESQTSDWRSLWIGIAGPPVSGRFNGSVSNDCIGAVQTASLGGSTVFVLYFTCQLDGTPAPPISNQWLSAVLPDSGGFSGTHQFGAGDFDNDGVDSIAVRRGTSIAFGNVAPATGPATFDLAQYIGAPGTGDAGIFVVGDWNADRVDSFGLFYQNGELFYRNDLLFNSGAYTNQSIGTPFGTSGVQATTWR